MKGPRDDGRNLHAGAGGTPMDRSRLPALRPPRDTLPRIVIGGRDQEDERICRADRWPTRRYRYGDGPRSGGASTAGPATRRGTGNLPRSVGVLPVTRSWPGPVPRFLIGMALPQRWLRHAAPGCARFFPQPRGLHSPASLSAVWGRRMNGLAGPTGRRRALGLGLALPKTQARVPLLPDLLAPARDVARATCPDQSGSCP
jgi:hypothetical protein